MAVSANSVRRGLLTGPAGCVVRHSLSSLTAHLATCCAPSRTEHGDYELILVSPRNHMVYTPLLPSAVGGVVSETSIVESIRTLIEGKVGAVLPCGRAARAMFG